MVSTWPLPTSMPSFPTPREQGKCPPWGPSDDSLPGLAPVLPGSRESPLLSDHRPHAFKSSPFPPRPPCRGIASTLLLCHPSWPRQSLLRRPGLQGSGAGLVGDGGTLGGHSRIPALRRALSGLGMFEGLLANKRTGLQANKQWDLSASLTAFSFPTVPSIDVPSGMCPFYGIHFIILLHIKFHGFV